MKATCLIPALFGAILYAQSTPPATPKFDVVSIKRCQPGVARGGDSSPGRLSEGGPDWIHSETFGIDAKSDGHPSITMMLGPMMQAILEDRFKLEIHRETRQGPVYELAL